MQYHWCFAPWVQLEQQQYNDEGLTSEEDRGWILSFKQSCCPGVKPQPEAHSQHSSTCQLKQKEVEHVWKGQCDST